MQGLPSIERSGTMLTSKDMECHLIMINVKGAFLLDHNNFLRSSGGYNLPGSQYTWVGFNITEKIENFSDYLVKSKIKNAAYEQKLVSKLLKQVLHEV